MPAETAKPGKWAYATPLRTKMSNYTILDRRTRLWAFDPDAAARVVTLPDARRLRLGAFVYVFFN